MRNAPPPLMPTQVLQVGVGAVLAAAATTPAAAPHLLRVEQRAVLQPYGFVGSQHHHIPLVPEIVPSADLGQQLLLITPPPGKWCAWLWVCAVCSRICAHLHWQPCPLVSDAGPSVGMS